MYFVNPLLLHIKKQACIVTYAEMLKVYFVIQVMQG